MGNKKFVLQNGVEIPVIGFGTGIAKGVSARPLSFAKRLVKEQIKNIIDPEFRENNKYPAMKDYKKDKTLKSIADLAAKTGCRLFDTARAYEYSEQYLGDALFRSGKYRREEFFIITKVTNRHQLQEDGVRRSYAESLAALGTDYADLLLLHWPQTDTFLKCWKELEHLYEAGQVRAIGVSNCHIHHLEEIKKVANVMPMVNEVECHPLHTRDALREYCKKEGIQVIAYTPTGRMDRRITEHPDMIRICRQHGIGAAQVMLRWHFQLGDISIPNTTNSAHLLDNLNLWDGKLTDEEMLAISSMNCNDNYWPDSDNCDFSKL